MSSQARRHIAPIRTILSNEGLTTKTGKETDHLPTWGDDQPHASVLVHLHGNQTPLKFADIIRGNMHPHREE